MRKRREERGVFPGTWQWTPPTPCS